MPSHGTELATADLISGGEARTVHVIATQDPPVPFPVTPDRKRSQSSSLTVGCIETSAAVKRSCKTKNFTTKSLDELMAGSARVPGPARPGPEDELHDAARNGNQGRSRAPGKRRSRAFPDGRDGKRMRRGKGRISLSWIAH